MLEEWLPMITVLVLFGIVGIGIIAAYLVNHKKRGKFRATLALVSLTLWQYHIGQL